MSAAPSTPDDANLSALGRELLDTGGSGSKPSGPWVPPTAEELGRLLPDYEIVKMLGRGGMGAVYMGRQKSLDRPVAIKILSTALEEADPSFAERFKNEARAMGKLNHPGIVAVHDFGEATGGLLYIVMEFVEGTDVAKMIAKEGRLHTEHAMAITAHVCDALAYAHERGIIHRDIKPANVMVGNDGTVKIADFGLAKVNVGGKTLGLTVSGMTMGTLPYMAPEALALGGSVDHRADIYAVGVMLYQMLSGKLPQGLFKLPSLLVPGLDPRYDDIVRKALMDDRESRYQSASELRHDLDGILTQPVLMVEPDVSQAPVKALTSMRPRDSQSDLPPRLEMPRPRSSSGFAWAAVAVMSGLAAWFYLQSRSQAVVLPEPAVAKQSSPPLPEPQTKETPPATVAHDTTSGRQPDKDSSPASQTVAPASSSKVIDNAVPMPSQSTAPAPVLPSKEPMMSSVIGAPDPSPAEPPAGSTVWTDAKGRSITAIYKGASNGNVLLSIAGKETPVPFSTLSVESQNLARAYHRHLSANGIDDPSSAAKDKPFVNSLGMKFVPVKITGGPTDGRTLLFSVWETRVQDFAPFVAETNCNWSKPDFCKGPLYPASGVLWEDARAFCDWLTEKEKKAGKLGKNVKCRLPSDHEWSCAAGIGNSEDSSLTPSAKDQKIKDVYPWGNVWPPPPRAGNFAGEELQSMLDAGRYPNIRDIIYGYKDDHPEAAPVGSYTPNSSGLYDMAGNVWEWCEDYWLNAGLKDRSVRGGSWTVHERSYLLASKRHRDSTFYRRFRLDNGFRVVLELP